MYQGWDVAALERGSVVASYRVERLLGRGGMGEVYLAHDLLLERRVALKVLTQALGADERFRERFLGESRLAAAIDHPNILPVYEAGDADGLLFIAMRYVEGPDLRQLVSETGPLDHSRAIRLVGQVGDALDAAHEHGLVHRDVKPANVLIASQGGRDHCYLCDFGLSRGAGSGSLTVPGGFMGTADYVAPEQAEGLAVDHRVDVYALGCVLVECLTGAVPYPRDSDLAALWAHIQDPPPSLHERRSELPAELDEVAAKALAKDPEQRYQTCGELAEAARAALGLEGDSRPSRPPPLQTFLFCDIRGYTAYTNRHGDEAAAALASRFAEIAREGVEARGGRLLELRGDEALSVFPSARDAIRAAAHLQQRFVQATLDDPEAPLTVGMGLDAGEAVPVGEGYRGGALNLAARLRSEARAGEILASRELTHLARAIDGIRYEDRGVQTLKGIAEPVRVTRVVPEGFDPAEQLRPFAAPAPRRRSLSRRAVGVAIVVAGVAAAAVAVPLSLLAGGGDEARVRVATNSVARLDAAKRAVQLSTELGERPGATAIGFGSVWVLQPDRGRVARLNADDGSVTDTMSVGTAPTGIAVGLGAVWVTNAQDATVSRIDPETGEVTQTLASGSTPAGIAVGDGALWIADTIGAQLLRLDPASGATEAVPLSGEPSGVSFTPSGVWVSVSPAGITQIDPESLTVTLTKTVGSGPTAVLHAFGSIWVANHLDGTVSRVDPATGRVLATIGVGEGPASLAAAAGAIWVANEFGASLAEIDPSANALKNTVPAGGAAASLTSDGDALWLAVGAGAGEHRGGTLSISSVDEGGNSVDPAVAYDVLSWQILSITNDGLLAFKKVGGPEGATLVPDLAAALPQVSPDGLTYRFALRPGIRYSTGQPVQAEDFRHALERTAAAGNGAYLYEAIEGVGACSETPSSCNLSASVVTDETSVTFRLSRPDPDLPFKLALPYAFAVPVSVPLDDQVFQPLPATGPYRLEKASAGGIELVRNPAFREWSTAAQPDGFVDRIEWRFGQDATSAFDQLTAGGLDVLAGEPASDDLASIETASPDRLVPSPDPITYNVGFDVLKPPFDDVRVRQALSYALDRDHVVELVGAGATQRATCQILPQAFQGYAPFCPFTIEPEAGVWSAPNLEAARRLIDEAGAAGSEVTVLGSRASDPVRGMETAEYIAEVLNELGLRARVEVADDDEQYFSRIFETEPGSDAHPHAYLSGWASTYLGASDFIKPQFGCQQGGNPSGYCNEELDAMIDEAQELQTTDPGAANRAWVEIEHQLVEDAVQVPLTNQVSPYVLSSRTGNAQAHPQWGLLVSRLWVR